MTTRREELAWAAGFLDGEGNFRFDKRRHYRPRGVLVVQAAQRRHEPLDRLAQALGGRVYGPYHYEKTSSRPYFTWSVGTFEKSQAVIALVWSFLSPPKREQVREALAQCAGAYAEVAA